MEKEFYKNEKLKTIRIVIRNALVDTIYYDEAGNRIKKESINENDISYFWSKNKIEESIKNINFDIAKSKGVYIQTIFVFGERNIKKDCCII